MEEAFFVIQHSMSKTSIVLPTRNRLPFLQRAVTSVLTQSDPYWELIVVDDASDDGTWDWLLTIGDIRIHPIRLERHSERSTARNIGLTAATGEFVLFLDDDDYLLPHALATLKSALLKKGDAIAAIGARLDVYQSKHARYPHPKRFKELIIWPELLAGWMPAQGQYIVRTSVIHHIGGWSEQFSRAEDVDLWFRLCTLGPVVFVPDIVMHATRDHPDKPPLSRDQRAYERHLIDELARTFVDRLQGADRGLGERILLGRVLWEEALQAYYDGHHVRCIKALMQMYHCAPYLFRSPILGPPLRRQLARAILGLFLKKEGRRKLKSVVTKLQSVWPRKSKGSSISEGI